MFGTMGAPSDIVTHDGFRKVSVHVEEEVMCAGTNQRVRQLTVRDPFSRACDIRSQLPIGVDGFVSTQTVLKRLQEVELRARVPATVIPLTAQHRARCLARCYYHRTFTIK
ncbi:hypothetical protein TNCV_2262011 [Trichonephila clavipes]|nr:hypothetical protein TNCV_2262011 [Trichonephila clavipes]